MISKSSGLKSKLNSIPISSCAALSSSFCPGIGPKFAFSAVGGGFGAAGVKARPLTFLRFMERGAKPSAMVGEKWGWDDGRFYLIRGEKSWEDEVARISAVTFVSLITTQT
jgi:hypothetical protein